MELTTTQKRQRLLTMIFGAIAIFFTGYPHVWSIYQPYVMEQAGWSQTAASMCFYLALSMTSVHFSFVCNKVYFVLYENPLVPVGYSFSCEK